jgi:uncharacterized membrane protein YuzA (DUF378 family)
MMDIVKLIALILVIVASLNLGLVGLFNLDVVAKIFAVMPLLIKVFHILVGLSGVLLLVFIKDYLK